MGVHHDDVHPKVLGRLSGKPRLASGRALSAAERRRKRVRSDSSKSNIGRTAPYLDAAQRERLTERDRLWDETMKLDSDGKLADALVAAESVLAIERSVLGEKSDDAIDSMELIASIHERRENWPEAIAMRRDVLKLQVRVLGESHWKVTDARLAVQDVERRAAMKRRESTTARRGKPPGRRGYVPFLRGGKI